MIESKQVSVESESRKTAVHIINITRKDAGQYEVVLKNTAGTKTLSVQVNVADKPSAPQDLTVSDITATTMKLMWAPAKDDGGSALTHYVVEKRDANRVHWSIVSDSVKFLFCIITIIYNKLLVNF